MTIHPTAIVDSSAILGPDVQIGPFVVIGPQVQLGARCRIFSHAVIEYTRMGDDCCVYPQVTLGLPPQHLGYKNEPSRVEIGSRCTFREGVTVHRGTALDKCLTQIGNDCYFMSYSHIAHDCVLGNQIIMANSALLAGHVHVGDRVFISATAGIHQFVRIGPMAMISGGAMVPTDVVPFATVQGDRARLVGINLVGLKRGGVDRESVKLIKKAFRIVFHSKLTLAEALKKPELNIDNTYIKILSDFLSTPRRGFIRPNQKLDLLEEGELE